MPAPGVMVVVIGHVKRGALALDNIAFDVEELHGLDRIEQAQRFEEAHRRIDEVQRVAPGDAALTEWIERQRQRLTDMQQLIFEN
jgi:hypothetical protein